MSLHGACPGSEGRHLDWSLHLFVILEEDALVDIAWQEGLLDGLVQFAQVGGQHTVLEQAGLLSSLKHLLFGQNFKLLQQLRLNCLDLLKAERSIFENDLGQFLLDFVAGQF